MQQRGFLGVIATAGVLLFSACASAAGEESVASPVPVDADDEAITAMLDPCFKPNLTTVEPGALTFATSSVPAPPFFLTDEPSDREGVDSDLAYLLAEQLGFRPGEVTWEIAPVEQILSGEFVDYDVALGGLTVSNDASVSVVFSRPYLDIDAAVVADAPELQPSGEGIPEDPSPTLGRVELVLASVSGNPLSTCIDRALTDMSEAGTLEALRERWLDPSQLG